MPLDLYLAFVLATTVLILLPGPNVTLLVANSLAYGRGRRWPRSPERVLRSHCSSRPWRSA